MDSGPSTTPIGAYPPDPVEIKPPKARGNSATPTVPPIHEQTMVVYRGFGGLLHFPLAEEETTVCGQPLDWFERRDHPVSHAGLWCTDCLKRATS